MKYEELLKVEKAELAEVMEKAQVIRQKHFGKRIFFYAPSFTYYKTEHYCSSQAAFPSISITGPSCSLRCKHCNGIVLNTMYPAHSPERLIELCKNLRKKGAVGVLISGGCSPNGSVPLENFLDAMAEIKRDLKLTLFFSCIIIFNYNIIITCPPEPRGGGKGQVDLFVMQLIYFLALPF